MVTVSVLCCNNYSLYRAVLVCVCVVESEGAVGVVEVSEALARRPVLVLRRVRVVLRVPVTRELQGNGER